MPQGRQAPVCLFSSIQSGSLSPGPHVCSSAPSHLCPNIYVPRQRERWLHARGESPRTQCSVWHGIHLPQGLFSAGMSPSMPGFPFLPPEFHPAVKHSVWGSLFRCRRRLAGFSALTPRRSVSLPVRVCFYPSILLNGRDCSL